MGTGPKPAAIAAGGCSCCLSSRRRIEPPGVMVAQGAGRQRGSHFL